MRARVSNGSAAPNVQAPGRFTEADRLRLLCRFIGEKINAAIAPLRKEITELKINCAELETKHRNFRYVGVWSPGTRYEAGNFCTHDGSLLHCNLDTSNRPGGDVAWKLVCKRGADGKDLRAPATRLPTTHR